MLNLRPGGVLVPNVAPFNPTEDAPVTRLCQHHPYHPYRFRGLVLPRLPAPSSQGLVHIPYTEGGVMRQTPTLWQAKRLCWLIVIVLGIASTDICHMSPCWHVQLFAVIHFGVIVHFRHLPHVPPCLHVQRIAVKHFYLPHVPIAYNLMHVWRLPPREATWRFAHKGILSRLIVGGKLSLPFG